MATLKMRNLIVFCDGTWNEPEQLDNGKPAPTNVFKLYDALASVRGGRQRKHYELGVGERVGEAVPGGVYGKGLDKRVLGAYRFLRKRFNDSKWKREQNRIYLFGFSRGAYTARRISGLLAHCGLPAKASDTELAWNLYQARDESSVKKLKAEHRLFDVPVEMIGVWDTVKATLDADYHDSKLADNVAAGYHAMAIDEHRKFFPILKWTQVKRVRQVWFAGVHSDVGGGYARCGLSDISLRWMIDRALEHNLVFKGSKLDAIHPLAMTKAHDSYQGVWKTLGKKTRKVGATELVHTSVETRLRGPYAPKNLPDSPVFGT